MCTTMPLEKEVVVAGGLARSKALMKHLPGLLNQDVSVLSLPEYAGAIGAVMSDEGRK
jgi:activator of 2-hydroxyglutaryl-CoA dehydratase